MANPDDNYETFSKREDDENPPDGLSDIISGNDPQQTIEQSFGDTEVGDAYAVDFVSLLLMLHEELPTLHLKSGSDSAASIPAYDTEADVPDQQLAQQAGEDGEALVIADGELYRCTEWLSKTNAVEW